jgi:hypothetical protein
MAALLVAPALATTAMAGAVVLVSRALDDAGPAARLAAESAAGVLSYALALWLAAPAWCRDAAATMGIARITVRVDEKPA